MRNAGLVLTASSWPENRKWKAKSDTFALRFLERWLAMEMARVMF